MMTAQEIRSAMRQRRRALDERALAEASRAVCAHVLALPDYQSARCVMAYMASGGEIPLDGVLQDVLDSGRVLALPRCESPGVMTARRVQSRAQLVRGMYGLMEPDDGCETIDPGRIDLILAPGTAFDVQGHRIGQGGGYYDRFLPETHAASVGICHGFSLLACVPYAAHDCRMDRVITPQGVTDCRNTSNAEEESQ